NDGGDLGGVAAVGSRWDWRTGEYRRLPDDALHGDLTIDVIGGNSHLTVSRRVIDEIGTPEREFFFGFYDPLYCLRIAKAGYRLMIDGDLMRRYRGHAGRLNLAPRRVTVPDEEYQAIWRRYYTTRNYVYRMIRTFDRPDLARRQVGKAVLRSALSWARGPRYGVRYTGLQLRGVIDGYRGRLGRTVMPVRKAPFAGAGSLRVLQVVTAPQRRGAEVFAHQVSAELRNKGCEVRTAYLYPYDGEEKLPLVDGDTVLGRREGHLLERVPGLNPGVLVRLRRTIAEFKPDIVQVNGSRTVKYGAAARTLDGRGWALVYRNIGDPQKWVRARRHRLVYQRMVMPRVDGVVAVGEMMVDRVRSFYAITAPVVKIPTAVDMGRFLPHRTRAEVRGQVAVDEGAPVVLFVGSLTNEKRPDRLLRVFSEVQETVRDVRLWIVGNGPLRESFEREAIRSRQWERITMLGTRADVADFMHAADVLVLTSDTEGIPGVVLEAGAASLPTVATRVGAVAECVLDGRTGLLADADDERGLAKAVVRLLLDPFARKQMGIDARGWVAESFSLDGIAREYIDFYRLVLRRRGNGR
ncbi:MAG: glycosyltransferase, partial [Acidimicrobiales bacterium]